MYRLLIVDDEAIIADGLYEVFNNLKDIDLDIYKAYSGQEALSLLNRTRIDIVLTDILMPGMNGLQLMEIIHARWPKCKVIFLTGHNEFDYVYAAIQYEGVSYLLKTEGYDKIIAAVANAVNEIENNFKMDALLQQAQEQLGTTRNLLQEIYLNNVLRGELSGPEINQQQFDALGIPLKAKEPVIMLIGRIDDVSKRAAYSEKNRWIYCIRLIAEQYLSGCVNYVNFTSENSTLIWLVQPGEGIARDGAEKEASWNSLLTFIKGIAELMQEAFLKSAGKSVSFALDDSPAGWSHMQDRFLTLKMLLNYRIGKGSGMLLTDKSVLEKDLHYAGEVGKMQSNRLKINALEEILEYGTKEDFLACLNELTEKLAATGSMHDIVALEHYYSIALVMLSHINKWNLTEKIAFKIGLYKLINMEAHDSWSSAVEYLKQLGTILFEIKDREEEKRGQDVIGVIQKHIMDNIHLQNEVSLVRLAELVYFNPSYLSRLFKQVTGVNLSDYVSEYRIKKARRMLESPEHKIHEVAEAVGFGSATNFARFFKKLTGMTPNEYREAALNQVKR
jgi:two-component system response regulator YesN